jgi:ketosteroid isomerase-like protein
MKFYILPLTLIYFLGSCNQPENISELKEAVEQTELAFSQMAGEKGLAEAFYHFADEKAVLKRGNDLIKGRDAIKELYTRPDGDGGKLEWSPSFVDVAQSGDLAYTYGPFTFTYQDTAGIEQKSTGIFHTVWKRQEDGRWRFVWD